MRQNGHKTELVYGRIYMIAERWHHAASSKIRAITRRRYSITLYHLLRGCLRWDYAEFTLAPCWIPHLKHWTECDILPVLYLLSGFSVIDLHLRKYRIIFINKLRVSKFHLRSWAHLYRYISANQSVNPPSEKSICYTRRWNVSGKIVYSRLAGRLHACV